MHRFERELYKTTLEELSPSFQDLVRDQILSGIEDTFDLIKDQSGGGVLAQWDILLQADPRIIGFKTKNRTTLIPYLDSDLDLDQGIINLLAEHIDPNFEPEGTNKDIFVNDADALDDLPDSLREYWGKSLMTYTVSYRLKSRPDTKKYLRRISYCTGSPHSLRAIAERWIIDEEDSSPIGLNSQFKDLIAVEPVREQPIEINSGLLIPSKDYVFSRN